MLNALLIHSASLAQGHRLDEFFPPDPSPNSLLNTGMSGGLVGDRHYDRQLDLLEKAQSDGKVIYRGETDKSRRRMGISLVKLNELGQGESGGLIEDEIFGPVLPIIPVEVGLTSVDLTLTSRMWMRLSGISMRGRSLWRYTFAPRSARSSSKVCLVLDEA